jgi:hypothetical protein
MVLPDTNLFFECQKLEQLPWPELGEGPLVLLLTKPVLDEIDEHKRGGGRTKRRALQTYKRVRDLLEAGEQEVRLDIDGGDVTLRLAGALLARRDIPSLTITKPDDHLIAILAGLVDTGEDAFLLTHDTGPASTANGLGLPFRLIPEHWLRPPERTEEERKRAALEEELKAYRSAEPNLSLRLAGCEASSTVKREIDVLEPLEDAELDLAINALRQAHPPKTDYSDPPKPPLALKTKLTLLTDRIRYEAPAEDDQKAYLDEAYPAWLDRCRAVLADLHEGQRKVPPTSLVVELENDGSRPATGLRISFEARGYVRLMRPNNGDEADSESGASDQDQRRPTLPSPPEPPAWRKVVEQAAPTIATATSTDALSHMSRPSGIAALIADAHDPFYGGRGSAASVLAGVTRPSFDSELFRAPMVPRPRDPDGFYYREWSSSVPVEQGALTCERFQHQSGPETFELEVVFADRQPHTAAIQVEVHAENLTHPVKLTVPVEQVVRTRKPIAELRAVLQQAGASFPYTEEDASETAEDGVPE